MQRRELLKLLGGMVLSGPMLVDSVPEWQRLIMPQGCCGAPELVLVQGARVLPHEFKLPEVRCHCGALVEPQGANGWYVWQIGEDMVELRDPRRVAYTDVILNINYVQPRAHKIFVIDNWVDSSEALDPDEEPGGIYLNEEDVMTKNLLCAIDVPRTRNATDGATGRRTG